MIFVSNQRLTQPLILYLAGILQNWQVEFQHGHPTARKKRTLQKTLDNVQHDELQSMQNIGCLEKTVRRKKGVARICMVYRHIELTRLILGHSLQRRRWETITSSSEGKASLLNQRQRIERDEHWPR